MTKVGRPRKGEVRQKESPSAKHPLIKAFDENRYWVISWDGGFCLYDKETPCNRANAAFMGKFYINNNGDKYVFNENYYKTVPELIDAMELWLKAQPFDRTVYDPTYRIHIRLYYAIYDYLIGLGFKKAKQIGYRNEDIFVFNDCYGNELYKIYIKIEDDSTKGEVTRYMQNSTWEDCSFDDYDSAFAAINSMLVTFFMTLGGAISNMFDKMTSNRANNVIVHHFDVKTMTEYTANTKKATIEMLEKELEELKKE